MGSILRNWEFDSQSNNNADYILTWDLLKICPRFDLSWNCEAGQYWYFLPQQVANDLPTHGQIVDGWHLKYKVYLDKIDLWSYNQEMILSKNKTLWTDFKFTQDFN